VVSENRSRRSRTSGQPPLKRQRDFTIFAAGAFRIDAADLALAPRAWNERPAFHSACAVGDERARHDAGHRVHELYDIPDTSTPGMHDSGTLRARRAACGCRVLARYEKHGSPAPDGFDFDFLNSRASVTEPEIH